MIIMKSFIGILLCSCLFLLSTTLVAQQTEAEEKANANTQTCIEKNDSKDHSTTCCVDPTCCDKSKTEACSPSNAKKVSNTCVKKTDTNKAVSNTSQKTFNTLLWLPGRQLKKDNC